MQSGHVGSRSPARVMMALNHNPHLGSYCGQCKSQDRQGHLWPERSP